MRFRFAILLPLLLVASGAVWFGAPQGAAQPQLECTLMAPQPEHPLEMNTVVSDPRTSQFRDPLFKHVIMEKELYECRDNVEARRFIRDHETFIEIIQKVQGGRTFSVKRVEEIICDREFLEVAFSCSARDIPLDPSPPNLTCNRESSQPTDPVEMNTAITSRQDVVKTLKVDKEIVACMVGGEIPARGHVYLFTEILEGRVGGVEDTIRPTEKKFQVIFCLFPPGGTTIQGCQHFIPRGAAG